MVFDKERMGAGEKGRRDQCYTSGPIGLNERFNES